MAAARCVCALPGVGAAFGVVALVAWLLVERAPPTIEHVAFAVFVAAYTLVLSVPAALTPVTPVRVAVHSVFVLVGAAWACAYWLVAANVCDYEDTARRANELPTRRAGLERDARDYSVVVGALAVYAVVRVLTLTLSARDARRRRAAIMVARRARATDNNVPLTRTQTKKRGGITPLV